MRALFFLVLVGCAEPPRNLVCERVAVIDPKATCSPEMSDVGQLHAHTARVTVEADGKSTTVVCGLNAGALAMVCDALQAQPKPAEAAKVAP